ncbi:MAG: FHA domain-containing protein, partial [Actinomycetota bacterium]|nr:FHA domain-containing protein [Actinomycetota bacterium]
MWLTLRTGSQRGSKAEIAQGSFVLGRDEDCDLALDDSKVSWHHASIELGPDGRAELRDLRSSNGTFVNGTRVDSTVLEGGEQIQLGDTVLVTALH